VVMAENAISPTRVASDIFRKSFMSIEV
jgi:hypothetical protein